MSLEDNEHTLESPEHVPLSPKRCTRTQGHASAVSVPAIRVPSVRLSHARSAPVSARLHSDRTIAAQIMTPLFGMTLHVRMRSLVHDRSPGYPVCCLVWMEVLAGATRKGNFSGFVKICKPK